MEFALVLPLLLVLLLGIADFARVFQAGIVLEASARNAAEAAAQEYLQFRRAGELDGTDYTALHDLALAEACREAERLPNRIATGTTCTMPFAAVCVHDGGDACGGEVAPPECDQMPALSTANVAPGAPPEFTPDTNEDATAYVTVYLCYRFTTILDLSDIDLPFGAGLSLGEIWLQRERSFAASDY